MAIITISRQSGSLGIEIAQALQKELNFAFLDKNQLEEKLVSEYGISKENVGRYDEKKPPFWNVFLFDKEKYLHFMKSAIYDFAKQDHCIIVGRGGQVLLENIPGAFHVRVRASRTLRVERIQQRDHVEKQVAEQMVDHSDRDRIGFHKFFFHADWDDENLYDLMLNTQFFTVEQAVRLVMTSLEMSGMREKKAETAQKLHDLCLGQHVMTEIAYKERIPVQFLEASVEQSVVTLKGTAITLTDIRRCEEIARKVPGVNNVVNSILSKDRDE